MLLLWLLLLMLSCLLLRHTLAFFCHFKNAKKFQPDTADCIKGKVSVLKYFSRDQHCKPYCVCSIFSDCSPKWDDIAKRFAHLLALHQNRAIDYYLSRPVFLIENGYVVKDKEREMIWDKVAP